MVQMEMTEQQEQMVQMEMTDQMELMVLALHRPYLFLEIRYL
jgi:hypothetical protein